ncbi:MAG: hypothetical protein AAFU80_09385 [Pseudomonadota bacterium]
MKESEAVLRNRIARLRRAYEAGGLSDRVRDLAHECIARAQRTLRVAVIGGNSVSTTDVANFFLGNALLPAQVGHGVPTRVGFGDPGEVTCRFEEGPTQTRPIDDLDAIFAEDPVSVSVSSPLPPLKRFTLVRLGIEGEPFASDISELLANSDVVFWCSDALSEKEMDYWSEVPAEVADHGYLVVSKGHPADDVHQRLFHQVIEVDIPRAEELRAAQVLDKAAFEDSGGAALLSAMRHEISTAERELRDAVNVALMRVGESVGRSSSSGATSAEPFSQSLDSAGDQENPWTAEEFVVSRAPRPADPPIAERLQTTSSAAIPSGGDAASIDDDTPSTIADVDSFAVTPQNSANQVQADGPQETEETSLEPSADIPRIEASALTPAQEVDAPSDCASLPALDDQFSGMISRLLEDAHDMLSDHERPSESVLDWVEDKLKSARTLIETHDHPGLQEAAGMTGSIDDALEAVGDLRLEEQAEKVREDALHMALLVGRELQTRLAG